MNIKECINQGYLQEVEKDIKLVDKEIKESVYDLERAQKTFKEEDYKWSIVKAYYSMFHAARALLFNQGLREKRHFAIVIVLEELNKKGKIEMKYVNEFKVMIESREDADYHYTYSKAIAEESLEIAKQFIERIRKYLKE